MIVDVLTNLNRYRGIHPNMEKAIDFLQTTDLNTLPDGKTEIDGENVFVNVMTGETSRDSDRKYEYHKHYIDLHLDLRGREAIAITLDTPIDIGTFDAESDGGLCLVQNPGQLFSLGETCFAAAFPWEPHLPMIALEHTESIHKCVVKIRMD